jgi:hypothetical protein
MSNFRKRIRQALLVLTTGYITSCQSAPSPAPAPAPFGASKSCEERAFELLQAMVEKQCECLRALAASPQSGSVSDICDKLSKVSKDWSDDVYSFGCQAFSAARLEKRLAKGIGE